MSLNSDWPKLAVLSLQVTACSAPIKLKTLHISWENCPPSGQLGVFDIAEKIAQMRGVLWAFFAWAQSIKIDTFNSVSIMPTSVAWKWRPYMYGVFPFGQFKFPTLLISLHQFPLCQLLTLSIPTSSTLTKWELTKWEIDKERIDKLGIDKVGIYTKYILHSNGAE